MNYDIECLPDQIIFYQSGKNKSFYTDVVFGSKEMEVMWYMYIRYICMMGLLFSITACAVLNKMSSLFLPACFKLLKVFTVVNSTTEEVLALPICYALVLRVVGFVHDQEQERFFLLELPVLNLF